MLLKSRVESEELITMRHLNTRMELSEKEKFHYVNLEKGYEGEKKFDGLTESLHEERYIIQDLLLEVNNSFFQIDTLIISQGVIHLLDVKNYQGDCYMDGDKLYSVTTGREYQNPIDQLKRSSNLLRKLLQSLKLNFLVESFVIFIHPEFTLYKAPMDQPIIFHSQVARFLNDLNKTPSKLNDGHKKLAQKLLSLHHTKNPFSKIPTYSYNQLQKGIYCNSCKSFHVAVKSHSIVCGKCGFVERIELAVLRGIKEYKMLFPDRKITTQSIYEWCKLDISIRTVRRILKRHYETRGNYKNTYFQ